MIKLKNLSKIIQKQVLLSDLNLEFNFGEISCIVGSNFSGKSTLLKILASVEKPSTGQFFFNDEEVTKKIPTRVGYLSQYRKPPGKAKVLDYLKYVGILHGLTSHQSEIEAIRFLDRFDLIEFTKKKIEYLKPADLQKISLIATFIHNPEIVLLDSPFLGLDLNNQIILRQILRTMQKLNRMIIIATHNPDIAETLADNIVLLEKGKTLLAGNKYDMIDSFQGDYVRVSYKDDSNVTKYLGDMPEVLKFSRFGNTTTIHLNKDAKKQDFLTRLSQIVSIEKYEVGSANLKDIILNKINKPFLEEN
jgi:ABC-2 type transport system ATP-binding protein